MNQLRTVMFKNFEVDDHILIDNEIRLNNCIHCNNITVNKFYRTNIQTNKTESISICQGCLAEELENIKKYQREDL